jgi:phage recombination protein Bet
MIQAYDHGLIKLMAKLSGVKKMAIANQVMNKSTTNIATINTDENTFRVLQETLYPGSTDQEVAMILSYCKARKIDPILKPVHLVPMNVKTDKKDKDGKAIYERKNVIMPGIGLYRIDASRSGQYAGIGEPEFGEEITEEFGKEKKKITYPKWCRITVRKIIADGSIAEFSAKEFWKENYATKSKWDETPNEMWEKRAYGQLAKCAEAQVLRKAFPDVVGNEYTKEEMEGKTYTHDYNRKSYIKSNVETIEHEATNIVDEFHEIEKDIIDISWADSIDNLKEIYSKAYKFWMNKKHKENMTKCVDAKDKKLSELENEQTVNPETGEVKE